MDLLSFDQLTHNKVSVAVLAQIFEKTNLKQSLCVNALLGQIIAVKWD